MQLTWRSRLDDGDEPFAGDARELADDDLAIVRRAQADSRAFAPLYERYAPIVYHYCLRRISHREAAADATAAIFTKALAALPKFRPDPRREGSTFRSWLFTIAHNEVIDQRRRNRGHLSLDAVYPALERSPIAGNTTDMLDTCMFFEFTWYPESDWLVVSDLPTCG